MKQKRRSGRSGADLRGGDRRALTKVTPPGPQADDLAGYRALRLVTDFGVRPDVATTLAELAFGDVR